MKTNNKDATENSIDIQIEDINDYKTTFHDIIVQQWQRGQFCDLNIKVIGGSVDVHSSVLFGFCNNLLNLFDELCLEPDNNKIDLENNGVTINGLRPIIQYIYSGSVLMKGDNQTLTEVKEASKIFGLEKIESFCENYLNKSRDITPGNNSSKPRKRGRPTKRSSVISPKIVKKDETANISELPENNGTKFTKIKDEIRSPITNDNNSFIGIENSRNETLRSSCSKTSNSIKQEPITFDFEEVEGLEEDEFKCFNCQAIFESFTEIENHLKLCIEKDDDKSYLTCEDCGLNFQRQSNLTRHKRRAHTDQSYLQCSDCEFKAQTEVEFRAHCKQNHDKTKPFSCDHPNCAYIARRFEFVVRHKQIHQELFDHFCENCGKTFSQSGGLISHQRTCYEQQSYLCDICGRAFNHSQSMKTHRRAMHFNEKPYSCDICDSRFSDHRNLKRHKRIHENSFPYCCEICGKQYRHSNSLKAHMVKHTNLKDSDPDSEKPASEHFKRWRHDYFKELGVATASLASPEDTACSSQSVTDIVKPGIAAASLSALSETIASCSNQSINDVKPGIDVVLVD